MYEKILLQVTDGKLDHLRE
jgi:hypothetical protein